MNLLNATLELLMLDPDFVLKPASIRYNSEELTTSNIISKILEDGGESRITEVFKGHDQNTVRKLLNLVFLECPRPSNTTHYFLHILAINGLKRCPCCGEIKSLELFSHNKAMKSSGRDSWCRNCMAIYRESTSDELKITKRNHQLLNKSAYAEASARRRASKLRASPNWADLGKIKEIYKNCPEGSHVDHWAPLQGTNVCGLHVPENLQYLDAAFNISKGNRFEDSDPYYGV